MWGSAQRVLKEALQLSPEDRAEVAAELLASLDESTDEDVEAAWAAEIERRARRVLSGESDGTDWAEARARVFPR
jgi:putative addiction module component (TIGR02574 family)